MQKFYRLIMTVVALAFFTLTGCALSPQTVTISPRLAGTGAGTGQRLAVIVRDTRANPVIGYRGGIYATAAITTAGDLNRTVQTALALAYGHSGFTIVEQPDTADIKLALDIESLDYKAAQNNIIWDIEFQATLRATATSKNGEKSLQLEDRVTRQYAKAPSEQENADLINDVITKLLDRLIENREFLSN